MGVRLLLEEVARLLRITVSLSDASCQDFLHTLYNSTMTQADQHAPETLTSPAGWSRFTASEDELHTLQSNDCQRQPRRSDVCLYVLLSAVK
jgi:hypothetical protein